MDIEGFVKRKLREGWEDSAIIGELRSRIREIKPGMSMESLDSFAEAVLEEAKETTSIELEEDELFGAIESGVHMGEFGVGSRGAGDFYVHEKIGELIGATGAVVDSSSFSDSGVVEMPAFASGDSRRFIVVTVDGMHSRLSDFPFIAGFHVARAALRDVYVMGAQPLALFSDIHVADDGDVGKIFDHIAGIVSVSDATGVPLITGSTLRIGGDVVIGERMTGCVGAVGVAEEIMTRMGAVEGDVILMSEGAGGGTISTAALYNGEYEVVKETLNVKFLVLCSALIESGMTGRIHVMTDVTNGGIRGDAHEIAKVSGLKLVLYEDRIRAMVNKKVLEMLERHGIDYLGVSLDALLVICPEAVVKEIREVGANNNVRIEEIGRVEEGEGAELVVGGERKEFTPRFRESAYTPVKRAVGEHISEDVFEAMKRKVDTAVAKARHKRELMKERLSASGRR